MKNGLNRNVVIAVAALAAVVGLQALQGGGAIPVANAAPAEKVTICHAAGQDGTLHYIELTLSYNGAFGQAGHFFEDGTPQAGHEDDNLGPCQVEEPSPSEEPSASPE